MTIIDLRTGKTHAAIAPHCALAEDIDVSPNGSLLAAIERGDYHTLDVYEAESGELIASASLASNQRQGSLILRTKEDLPPWTRVAA